LTDGFSEGESLGGALVLLGLSLRATLGSTDGISEGEPLGTALEFSLCVTLGVKLGSTLGCVDGAELCRVG
jgi:hypothetical protein